MRLKEKISIITGAASGFGKGIAKKFSEEGSKLILVDINKDLLEKVSKDLNQDFFYTDVASSSSMQELSKYVLKKYGTIDIMVNNAGITHLPKPLEEVSEKEFDKIFEVNSKSVFLCGKFFVPHMKKQKKGTILNISSTAGISPRPNLNWYNATKGWMITATKAMAVELAPFNIRVNSPVPLNIDSEIGIDIPGVSTNEEVPGGTTVLKI